MSGRVIRHPDPSVRLVVCTGCGCAIASDYAERHRAACPHVDTPTPHGLRRAAVALLQAAEAHPELAAKSVVPRLLLGLLRRELGEEPRDPATGAAGPAVRLTGS